MRELISLRHDEKAGRRKEEQEFYKINFHQRISQFKFSLLLKRTGMICEFIGNRCSNKWLKWKHNKSAIKNNKNILFQIAIEFSNITKHSDG